MAMLIKYHDKGNRNSCLSLTKDHNYLSEIPFLQIGWQLYLHFRENGNNIYETS